MKRKLLIFIYFILYSLYPHITTAQEQTLQGKTSDSIRISLLTCPRVGKYILFSGILPSATKTLPGISTLFSTMAVQFQCSQLHSPLRFRRDGLPVRSYQLRALCSRIQLPGAGRMATNTEPYSGRKGTFV